MKYIIIFKALDQKIFPNFNSDLEIYEWISKNIVYDNTGETTPKTPLQLIKDKKGHCHDMTRFAVEALTKLGYFAEALWLGNYVSDTEILQHSVALYKKENQYYWMENSNWQNNGELIGIHGPYETKESATLDAVKKYNDQNSSAKYTLYTTDFYNVFKDAAYPQKFTKQEDFK